jgi:hypothetical protein
VRRGAADDIAGGHQGYGDSVGWPRTGTGVGPGASAWGQGSKGEADPDGATFSWVRLLCGSYFGLQVRLL